MEKGPDGWHFKLTDKGFCALLRTDGLCEVITALGEDKLCDICTVHPRFFTYVDEFILCGTGLCCEASCELLLAPHEPLTFTEEDTTFGLHGLFPAGKPDPLCPAFQQQILSKHLG